MVSLGPNEFKTFALWPGANNTLRQVDFDTVFFQIAYYSFWKMQNSASWLMMKYTKLYLKHHGQNQNNIW